MVGGATRAVELTNSTTSSRPGADLRRRDISVHAAHLCNGVDLLELGPRSTSSASRLGCPHHRAEDGAVVRVLWTDGFGNPQRSIPSRSTTSAPCRAALRRQVRTGVRHGTYAEVPTGEIGLVVDSYGLVSVAANRTSAAEELSIGTGDEVILAAIGDEPVRAGHITPVTLKEKP